MKDKISKILLAILFLLAVYIFSGMLSPGTLSSGDWNYLYKDSVEEVGWLPQFWNPSGLGNDALITVRLDHFHKITYKAISDFAPWELAERVIWVLPTILLSILGSYKLASRFISGRFAVIASGIFSLNTYVLMIIGGGQLSVAIAYSLIPFIILNSIQVENDKTSKYKILILVLLYSLQILFYHRMTYITGGVVALYILVDYLFVFDWKNSTRKIFNKLIFPLFISFGIHSYWIIPLLISPPEISRQFGQVYTSQDALNFFSFANLENSLGFLHPLWPQNIFGKVGFMKPEFLILPILAFSSLLFIDKNDKKIIVFFSLLGLLGAFLSKGTNPPFGIIYSWMFDNIPGFIGFRDPTKWYALIAMSYSVLIPYSLEKIYNLIKKRNYKIKNLGLEKIFLSVILILLLFLISPALSKNLSGTFKPVKVTSEYLSLKELIIDDDKFYRTMWVPTYQRFGYENQTHPAIKANNYFKSSSTEETVQKLKSIDENIIDRLSVRYVIIPSDTKEEIFIEDRKYNEDLREYLVEEIDQIEWLFKKESLGNIAIYENPDYCGHIFVINNNECKTINYERKSPTSYSLDLEEGGRIIFSEKFSSRWKLETSDGDIISSSEYVGEINSFEVDRPGKFRLYYEPQKYLKFGLGISAITFLILLIHLFYLKKKK